MLNTVLLAGASKVVAAETPTSCTILPHFISDADGSTFSFYPIMVDSITFDFDYADAYSDDITLQMTISPRDYALMQDQGQNLLCNLVITYVDRYGNQVLDPPPKCIQYRAIINNAEDIRKTVPDVQMYTEPSRPISVQLMDPLVYDIRNTKINTIYQTSTVKTAIYAIAQELGITKVHLVEPDNTHVYDHIAIGSYQGISSIYGFLQSTCGIYRKGINAYITNGVLYIYPIYETDPTYDKSALLYQVDTGRYAGVPSLHRVKDDTVSIVINTQPQSEDLSILAAENVGTGVIFNRASRMGDGYTTIDSNQGTLFTEDRALGISLVNPRTAAGDRNSVKYIHGTDNPFPAMSELISYQASIMGVAWPNADPFLLDPCTKITYYYDRNEVMVSKTGILSRARYAFVRQQKVGTKFVFSCTGALEIRLSPNETQVI